MSEVCGIWCIEGYADTRSCELCREVKKLMKKLMKERYR